MKPSEPLRHFEDADDLLSNVDEKVIVGWVNELFKRNEQRAHTSRMYRMRQQMFTKVARQLLDKDEVERIEVEAVEAAERELAKLEEARSDTYTRRSVEEKDDN